jgi:hypothetical protein
LGIFFVSSLNLVPFPPQSITILMSDFFIFLFCGFASFLIYFICSFEAS